MKKLIVGFLTVFLLLSFSSSIAQGDTSRHPSDKDRTVEPGKSGTQGKSNSDPDGRTNGGRDKPGGKGGEDKSDQDGNNGCGNDQDFEDDNNGNCGKKKRSSTTTVKRHRSAAVPRHGVTPTSIGPDVFIPQTTSSTPKIMVPPVTSVQPNTDQLPKKLASTGGLPSGVVLLAIGALTVGFVLLFASRPRPAP